MISNPRHGSPPRLIPHQPIRCSTTQESSIRVHRPESVSPVTVDEEQRQGLLALSHSRDRGEADRARAILLTLSGWTSGQIAQAFGVREDTVRFWRSTFMTGGIEALR